MTRHLGGVGTVAALALLPAVLACAPGRGGGEATAAPAAAGTSRAWAPDPLAALLEENPLGPAALDSLGVLRARDGAVLSAHLWSVAVDSAVAPVARANAVMVLARHDADSGLHAAWRLRRDPAESVRAGAASAAGFAAAEAPEEAAALLRLALFDSAAAVQASALEGLARPDAELLRRYLATGPVTPLATIARGLLRALEERGAPLATPAGAPPGTLERALEDGTRIRFIPERAWPLHGAAVGRVSVLDPAGAVVTTLARGVEVVGGVVPAFVSPDGRWLVYEAERTVRVRDLATDSETLVGAGVAPRVLPFTEDFVFVREQRGERAERVDGVRSRLLYTLLRASFAGGAPRAVDQVEAWSTPGMHGGASPVRWMQVVPAAGDGAPVFLLQAEGLGTVPLPSPFARSAPAPAARRRP